MGSIAVRPLVPEDHDAWEPLWLGYQAFYKAQIAPEVSAQTWRRFHDPAVPMYALGAFRDDQLLGIVHYLYHYSCWTVGPYCYLQDLFTDPNTRGQGIGRALIEAVYAAALDYGASRVYWLTHETNAQAQILYDKLAARSGFIQYRKLFV